MESPLLCSNKRRMSEKLATKIRITSRFILRHLPLSNTAPKALATLRIRRRTLLAVGKTRNRNERSFTKSRVAIISRDGNIIGMSFTRSKITESYSRCADGYANRSHVPVIKKRRNGSARLPLTSLHLGGKSYKHGIFASLVIRSESCAWANV